MWTVISEFEVRIFDDNNNPDPGNPYCVNAIPHHDPVAWCVPSLDEM